MAKRIGPVVAVSKKQKRMVGPVVAVTTAREGSLASLVERMCYDLERQLVARAERFCVSKSFRIRPPAIPPGLTEAHLRAIRTALCGVETDPVTGTERPKSGLDLTILPSLGDLQDLAPNSNYVWMMYRETQHRKDTADGLTSYRPSWWDKEAQIEGFTFRTITDTNPVTGVRHHHYETCGKAYLRSMATELASLAPTGAVVLLDPAIKPHYTGGCQHYGTPEGTDPSQDPLLALFREAFGPDANRFDHTHFEITTSLLPLCKRKVVDAFTSRGLTFPKGWEATVMLVPASLVNLWMTMTPNGRASSSTDTLEQSSSTLLDAAGVDTGRQLVVGVSVDGGAAGVVGSDRGIRSVFIGARLAVVLRKKRD